MSRAITIGNGNLLVGIDRYGQIRDFYFPYAGHANHVSGASGSYTHRVGVWVDETLRWLGDETWHISISYIADDTLSTIHARNADIGVELVITDAVHNEHNVFLRKILVKNTRDRAREIKIFFGQEFRISESRRGDTAYFDPRVQSIIHYKGHNAFLVHASINDMQFSDYSVGLFNIEGKAGTYADAEDGILSRNAIEHGSVDSVIGVVDTLAGNSTAQVYYWIAAGKSVRETHDLHHRVLEEKPEALIASTEHYWHAWVEKETRDLSLLDESIKKLYQRSLQIIRVHADNRGGIIASSDSDILNQGRDTYSYVWPRDASMSAHALDTAHYFDSAERYFSFVSSLLERDGYLMHKYRVDGVLGSSWHPWIRDGLSELPIQEDETAIVVYMLAKHYNYAKDIEFIESLYNPFIEPASDFMCGYIDGETGLPASSYDLWEEKFGTSTYTAACVYGALHGAAEISALLGKRANAKKYRDRAEYIKLAILAHFYDTESKTFIKLIRHEGTKKVRDTTLDISSLHGLVTFGVLDPFDKRVREMVNVVEEKLRVPGEFGGYMRYEGDRYYKTSEQASPNAWCITTMWMAQYYIKIARSRKELVRAYEILKWTQKRATQSGILPEQINPYTGEHLSTAPLVWSHAELVITIDEYLKKYNLLT